MRTWPPRITGIVLLLMMGGLTQGSQGQGGRPLAPPPWHLGEVTPERTWWWGEVPVAPQVRGGSVICVIARPGLLRCTLLAQGVYRRFIVDGVVWEDRRQRTLLPLVRNGHGHWQWLPIIIKGNP